MKKKKIGVFLIAVLVLSTVMACKTPSPELPTQEPSVYGNYTLDAELSEWSAEIKDNGIFIPIQDGQSAYVYAVKTQDGIVIAMEANHYRFVTTSQNPLANAQFRFGLGNGDERYVVATGEKQGVTDFVVQSTAGESMRHTVFEIFVSKDDIPEFSSEVSFGFVIRMSGYQEDYFWGYGNEWSVERCSVTKRPFVVTERGLQEEIAQSAITVDGIADEAVWASAEMLKSSYANYEFSMKGFLSSEGVFLFLVADHDERNVHQYWCYNPNFEIRLGKSAQSHSRFISVLYNGAESMRSSGIDAFIRTEYMQSLHCYRTVSEIFVPFSEIGATAEEGVVVGASFRADERKANAWQPFYVNGLSTWNMNVLRLTQAGWEVSV